MFLRSFVIILIFLSRFALADIEPAQAAPPGQVVKYQTESGVLLADSDADWGIYSKIQLERGTVEFRENWVADQQKRKDNIFREADIVRLKTDMSDLLERVLTRKLTDSDAYTLTLESGKDVLRFTPRIEKLDIYATDRARNYVGHVLTHYQGSMVLVLDISDSVSGRLLASAVQKQADQASGYLDSTSSGADKTAFRRMMERWATWFLELFDEVRAGTLQ